MLTEEILDEMEKRSENYSFSAEQDIKTLLIELHRGKQELALAVLKEREACANIAQGQYQKAQSKPNLDIAEVAEAIRNAIRCRG